MNNPLLIYLLRFLAVILFQVLILNNIQFSGYLNPFFYVWVILVMPLEFPGWLLLLLSFFLGLGMDLFPQGIEGGSPTIGIHAAATVFMTFLRPLVLKWMSPRDGYAPGSLPVPRDYGWIWFIGYSTLMVTIHHLFLFIIEDFSLAHLFRILLRVILSVLFTQFIILLWEAVRYQGRRR